jgi:hypothetical protein
LLAAWLIGLIAVDGAFLTGAHVISNPPWAAGVLVLAAIANVPIFLLALFLLQTRFRPEMQEDAFYSRYLERQSEQTGKIERIRVKERAVESVSTMEPVQFETFGPREAFASTTRIHINDLLPDYSAIKEELIAAGLSIDQDFGSSSQPPTIPRNRILSFGPHCSIPTLQRALRTAAAHGIHGIARTPSRYVINERKIYIGAYSYEPGENPYHPLEPDLLRRLLDPELTEVQLQSLIPEVR